MATRDDATSDSDESRRVTGTMPPPAPWAAQLNHAQEVTVRGSAELRFWQGQLEPHGLQPLACTGRAQFMIVAAQGRFMGLRFREASVSILIEPPAGCRAGAPAAFLLQAFNSVRFFAFCERTLFATPYAFARVQLSVEPVPGFQVPGRIVPWIKAECHREGRIRGGTPRELGNENTDWEGYVVLPATTRRPAASPSAFFARIAGASTTMAFDREFDLWQLDESGHCEVAKNLIESGFTPERWIIRPDAQHAKSKTFRLTPK